MTHAEWQKDFVVQEIRIVLARDAGDYRSEDGVSEVRIMEPFPRRVHQDTVAQDYIIDVGRAVGFVRVERLVIARQTRRVLRDTSDRRPRSITDPCLKFHVTKVVVDGPIQ